MKEDKKQHDEEEKKEELKVRQRDYRLIQIEPN